MRHRSPRNSGFFGEANRKSPNFFFVVITDQRPSVPQCMDMSVNGIFDVERHSYRFKPRIGLSDETLNPGPISVWLLLVGR